MPGQLHGQKVTLWLLRITSPQVQNMPSLALGPFVIPISPGTLALSLHPKTGVCNEHCVFMNQLSVSEQVSSRRSIMLFSLKMGLVPGSLPSLIIMVVVVVAITIIIIVVVM